MEITRALAEKVRDTVMAGLVSGVGVAELGKMCVEAAVCYSLGLPHGDDPGCVAQSLRRIEITLNEASWSSKEARAAGLLRMALVQLGSAGVLDEGEFVRRVVDITIRRSVPLALRAAARRNPAHAVALEAAAVRCGQEGTREASREGERVARAAASAAAAAATAAAATAATAAGKRYVRDREAGSQDSAGSVDPVGSAGSVEAGSRW